MSESHLSDDILGHVRFEQVLTDAAASLDEIEVEILHVPRPRAVLRLGVRHVPGLARLGVDGQQIRWHLVHSFLASRAIARHLRARAPYDAVIIHTQSVAFGLSLWRPPCPVLLSTDVGTRTWRSFGIWSTSSLPAAIRGKLTERLERRTLDKADLILAWSAWTAATLPPTTTPIEVWHPGTERIWRPAEAQGTGREGLPVVLFVGGRFSAKGGDVFLDAVRPLAAAGRIRAVIVTAEDVPVTAPGVQVARMRPGSTELVEQFGRADLLVLPSRGDAVPWVAVEALRSGCPVVATPVGALPELVGEAGVIRPFETSDELRELLAGVTADPAGLARLRTLAVGAGRRFDNVANAQRLAELVRSLRPRAATLVG